MTPKPGLSFWDYVKAAFNASPVYPALGAVPVNKLAFGGAMILGFVNPGFWFAGIAIEAAYLWAISTDPHFQKYVQSQKVKIVKKGDAEKINAMILSLDPGSKNRLNDLNSNLAEILRLMEMDSENSLEFFKDTKQRTLNQLSILFLKLLISRRLIVESLQRTDIKRLKNEIKELQKQLAASEISEAMARSIKGTLEIQEKRSENLRTAEDNLQVIESELNRIENQVQLIREECAFNRSPDALSSSIDRVSSTLVETEQFVDKHSDLFGRMGTTSEEIQVGSFQPPPPPTREFEK